MKINTLVRFRNNPSQHDNILESINLNKYNIENIETTLSTDLIYEKYIKSYIQSTMTEHYNSTILAYGYSGSGKTYTINGILPLIIRELFSELRTACGSETSGSGIISSKTTNDNSSILDHRSHLRSPGSTLRSRLQSNTELKIGISVVEIYSDRAYDLLSIDNNEVIVLGNGDSTARVINHKTEGSLQSCINNVLSSRIQASTSINRNSSRSHMIIKFLYENASIFVVDLAGCERVCKSKAEGITLAEGKIINKNISSLHDVIMATSLKQQHIPYRNSKLTTLLKQSFGGDSKTFIFLCCSSELVNIQETNQTLDFGSRCMAIENRPKVHLTYVDAKDTMIQELQDEITDLKLQISLLVTHNKDLDDCINTFNTVEKNEVPITVDTQTNTVPISTDTAERIKSGISTLKSGIANLHSQIKSAPVTCGCFG
jgi:kinesin family protein 5